MRPGLTALRTIVGALFVGHGTQKLFGWFEGNGLEATAQFFEGIGLRPGRRHALAAGAAETGGGALLLLGRANPFAAAVLTATMLTAIRRVHLQNGPWATKGGYEYNLVLIAAALALAAPSHRGREGGERDWPWALGALLAGVAGAAGAELAARAGQPPAAPETAARNGTGQAGEGAAASTS
ncbi:MAG TPA: DoxX family protein [Solirubrobacteraceae bacterium]|nr:DoxX family protein [Solirubrobacteraceae bacterium]